MPGTSDVIYLYDGSFEGLLCCVHESVYTHELPVDIQPEEAAQPTLFRQKYIAADEEKAARVYDSIPRKISPDAAALVQCVFLSCMPGKELAILRFLLLGYRRGRTKPHWSGRTAKRGSSPWIRWSCRPPPPRSCATASFGSDFTRPSPSLRGKTPAAA